ncbi:uncharacterized protein LOC130635919 [Hydractinia symbiolongicarpus]|uniref:uncharacterized protein LOC130635919 n=1 Tax=Hydractinia symbiolongicarpus TaxID=13093 RepID=UPI00254A1663|nr:uncharacterized protein LOC130635919 [Hydractinia symbiolongicarpus]
MSRIGEEFEENVRLKTLLEEKGIHYPDQLIQPDRQNKFVKYFYKKGCLFWTVMIIFLLIFASMVLVPSVLVPKEISKWVQKGVDVKMKEESFKMSAQRYDDRIQDCHGDNLKMSFPDFDYALFGYNIIFGYPLAVGHDPGLTHPIFTADYSRKKQTADCHYSLPYGYIVSPDVSCVTSFSSKVVQNSNQFSKSLSTSASVSGGGWGVSFSASYQYKEKLSVMSSSESLFIFSEAKCNYYFAMLDEKNPPQLDQSFINTAKSLNTDEDIFDFFDYYGTHYLKYVLFGARFVYEHKMSKSAYKKETSKGQDVSVQASYSGLFSVGASFGMTSKQKQSAQNFQENVQTSTITIGAPPPDNGDATRWASTVKNTPVPVQYKMESIENLFTAKYMRNSGIDYYSIRKKVIKAKQYYCKKLFKDGTVDSCNISTADYIKFEGIGFGYTFYKQISGSSEICIATCIDEPKCVASTFGNSVCSLYEGSPKIHTLSLSSSLSCFIFLNSMKILDQKLRIQYATFSREVSRDPGVGKSNETVCMKSCEDNKVCAAYSFKSGKKCLQFQQSIIKDNSLKYDKDGTITVIQP